MRRRYLKTPLEPGIPTYGDACAYVQHLVKASAGCLTEYLVERIFAFAGIVQADAAHHPFLVGLRFHGQITVFIIIQMQFRSLQINYKQLNASVRRRPFTAKRGLLS